MGKTIYVLMVLLLGAAGCQTDSGEVDELQKENDRLRKELTDHEEKTRSLQNAVNMLNMNMGRIDSSRLTIDMMTQSGNMSAADKDQVRSRVEAIQELIESNDSIFGSMSEATGSAGFRGLFNIISDKITDKEAEVNQLKYELASSDQAFQDFDYHLELLSTINNEQAALIALQEEMLTTAWYTTGSFKKLRDKGIINKQKGFFKLGKKLGEADQEEFTRVNIKEFTELELTGSKIRIATAHPDKSYKIDESGSNNTLTITDPEMFWSTSRYLVVVVD